MTDHMWRKRPFDSISPSNGEGESSGRLGVDEDLDTPLPRIRLNRNERAESELSSMTGADFNSVNAMAVTQECSQSTYQYPEIEEELPKDEDLCDIDEDDVVSDVEGEEGDDFCGAKLQPEEAIERKTAEAAEPEEQDAVYLFKDGTYEKSLRYPKVPSTHKPQQNFDYIDNPGGWNDYIYTPKYKKVKGSSQQYLYHSLPSGATPVKGSTTIREHKGWKFHYVAWNGENPGSANNQPRRSSRSTTPASAVCEEDPYSRKFVNPTSMDIFPKERSGSLDADKLRKYDLTKDRMKNGDALFFYQLLLPFHKQEKFGEEFNDTRKNYYQAVGEWTNYYQNEKYEFGYTETPRQIGLEELLKFDGILYLHGALGSKHSMEKRWKKDSGFYNQEIATSKMSWHRWNQIKRNLKLCNNEKADIENLSYKFDHIYECLIHNLDVFTLRACLDLVIDESTWPYYGFGPFVDYLVDKMVSRGGQTVLLMDADRLRPRGFLHRRKSYEKEGGFPTKGMSEVYHLIKKYVLPKIGKEKGKKWCYGPHLTVDNYFNGDEILDWMGENGLGMIGTVARNRLPKGIVDGVTEPIEGKYYHKESASGNPRARLARFANPITLVRKFPSKKKYPNGTIVTKPIENGSQQETTIEGEITSYNRVTTCYRIKYSRGSGKAEMTEAEVTKCLKDPNTPFEETKSYRRVHCSFQSTGPCNIGSVNSIPRSYFYVSPKERGRASKKLKWGIEMNHSRELYLKSYGRIDRTDSLISSSDIKYTSWKYYHAALNHAKALVIATAYDMYKECAEGELDPEWELDKSLVLSFNEFQQRLGKQMIRYKAKHLHYPGDSLLRAAKQAPLSQRGQQCILVSPKRHRMRSRTCPWYSPHTNEFLNYISIPSVVKAKKNGRLCENLSDFEKHQWAKEHFKSPQICHVCGADAYTRCMKCIKPNGNIGVPLCSVTANPQKMCYVRYHNPEWFGLGREDFKHVRNQSKNDWSPPSLKERINNAGYMEFMLDKDKSTEDSAS